MGQADGMLLLGLQPVKSIVKYSSLVQGNDRGIVSQELHFPLMTGEEKYLIPVLFGKEVP